MSYTIVSQDGQTKEWETRSALDWRRDTQLPQDIFTVLVDTPRLFIATSDGDDRWCSVWIVINDELLDASAT